MKRLITSALTLALVAMVGLAGNVSAYPSGSAANHPGNWNNQFDHPAQCYKHEGNSAHGSFSRSDKFFTLAAFNQAWPGDHWEALIIKAGTVNDVFVHPTAGVLYSAVSGKGISHVIVCKGTTPDPTPTPTPTTEPTPTPTPEVTPSATPEPTPSPTPEPSEQPSESPSPTPTPEPSSTPTASPSVEPSDEPSPEPSTTPSAVPSEPSDSPTPTLPPTDTEAGRALGHSIALIVVLFAVILAAAMVYLEASSKHYPRGRR